MWLGLLEALTEWLAKEGKPLSKDRATQRAVESKVGTLTVGSSAVEVNQPGIVKQQAHEILKGRR